MNDQGFDEGLLSICINPVGPQKVAIIPFTPYYTGNSTLRYKCFISWIMARTNFDFGVLKALNPQFQKPSNTWTFFSELFLLLTRRGKWTEERVQIFYKGMGGGVTSQAVCSFVFSLLYRKGLFDIFYSYTGLLHILPHIQVLFVLLLQDFCSHTQTFWSTVSKSFRVRAFNVSKFHIYVFCLFFVDIHLL